MSPTISTLIEATLAGIRADIAEHMATCPAPGPDCVAAYLRDTATDVLTTVIRHAVATATVPVTRLTADLESARTAIAEGPPLPLPSRAGTSLATT